MPAARKSCGFLAGALLVCLALPGAADPAALRQEIHALVRSAMKNKKAFRGKKVGTGNFVHAGKPTRLGTYIAKQVQVALFQLSSPGGFEVLERSQLCQLAREHALWTDDSFRDSDAQKIGNLNGLDALTVGDVEVLGENMTVTISVVNTGTSKVMAAVSGDIRITEAIKKLLGESAVSYCADEGGGREEARSGGLEIKLWPMKKSYLLGEKLRFQFQTNRDAYVTLVDLGTTGGVTIIYPNRFSRRNFVRAGRTVTVPSEEADFEFILAGKPGRETVRAIATEEPVDFLPKDFADMRGPVKSLSRRESTTMTRNISAVRSKIPSSSWGEAAVSFEIR